MLIKIYLGIARRDVEGQESHSVVQFANSERFQTTHAIVFVRAVDSGRGLGSGSLVKKQILL
jgi:hypothetical protein